MEILSYARPGLLAGKTLLYLHGFASSGATAASYVRAVKDLGWFDMASCVVAGLEMNEYWNISQANPMVKSIWKFWKGKLGVHHTNDHADFIGLADILFYQVSPGASVAQIKKDTKKALSHGKPVNFFEIERNPSRQKCQAALDSGAFAVGNW